MGNVGFKHFVENFNHFIELIILGIARNKALHYICGMEQDNTFDKLENTKAQMRKGVLELCVLSIIAQKEAYPTDIIEQLRVSKLIVVEGTLYPLLNRLKNAGLLTYNWQEATEGRKGPPRKYYDLTDTGKTFLHELQTTWDELVQAVHHTTKNSSTNE